MRIAVLPLLVGAALTTNCVVSVDSQGQISREEKRFSVTGVPDVHLTTFDGSIEIQSWDKPDVLVEVEKRGPTRESVDALEVKATQNGNRIELEVKRPREESFSSLGLKRSASARLIVSMPRRADLYARSGDGSIRVERIEGKIELHTGDGSIRASDVSGDLTLNTGDGSVTVDGAEGRLDLETGDGGVNVTGRLTAVKLRTGDGSIVYHATPGVVMADDWDINTSDGSVTLFVPADFSAELDAHTGDGSIRNDLTVRADGGEVGRHTLRGRIGAGGKQLRIRTGDGAIRLRVL